MKALDLYSEPFAKTGNMNAGGVRRLLGRPALGLLQTFVREGIQNSLDAALGDGATVVRFRIRTLTAAQCDFLRNVVLANRPRADAGGTGDGLLASIAQPQIRVLELCDFGTEGLSGPTDADAPRDGGEPTNFIDFLRNVGAARDKYQGGGTYGFGKSSLYAMSRCATIVVDSQTTNADRPVRRFMASHLGAAFDGQSGDGRRRRFTGRHWWGVFEDGSPIEPVKGDLARDVARALGMPDRGVSDRGTSILIVDPVVNEGDVACMADDIVETALWYFWPRMTASTPKVRLLQVEVELNGRNVPVPAPEDFPPLDLFAAAIAKHRGKSQDLQRIWCFRPRKQVGALSVQRGLSADRCGPARREASIIPKQAHHIALMRPIELVVRYIEGEPLPDSRFEWAGVFICSNDDEVEGAFADAEPPAHDDWVPDNLPQGREKTFVRVALRRLEEIAKPVRAPVAGGANGSGDGPSLAATAAKMGAFLGTTPAASPGRPQSGPRSPSSRKPLRISAPRFNGLQLDVHGHAVARFRADLENDGSDAELRLVAEACLVVDGGSTDNQDLPDDFDPVVTRIEFCSTGRAINGSSMRIGKDAGPVQIFVRTVQDAAVGVRLKLCSGAEK